MSTKFNIIYSCILALLVIMMLWIFSMGKSAQLTLDIQDIQHTVEEKDQKIISIQQTLKDTIALAENVKNKNKAIPELTKNIAALEEEIAAYRQQLEKEKTAYKQHLDSLQGELQIQQTQIDNRLVELQTLKKEYVMQQEFLAQSEKAKLSSEAQTSEIAEALTASQELLNQKEDQLKQLTTALEEKSSSIAFFNKKLQDTEELLSLSESENATNKMNLSLILDELGGKGPLPAGADTDQNVRNATTEMNLTLILDELIQKTQLANELQDKINLLAIKGTQSATNLQSQQSIEETRELFQATNATIAMNMSLILDELLVKTQLADELQAKINVLSGSEGKIQKSTKVTAISEIEALMEKMGRKKISLSQVEKKLLEANAQIHELEISKASLQSNVDKQGERIQALLMDLQAKENLLSSDNEKLKQQQLDNQATVVELDKLRIETKETDQKLAQLQISLDNKTQELETTVQQAQAITVPMKEKVTSLELQLTEALKINERLTDQNNILTQELVPLKTSLEKALAEVALLTAEIQTAKTALQHEEDTRLSLTSETEGTKLALSQAKEQYTSLSSKFTELEKELTRKTSLQTEQVTSLEQQLADALKNTKALTDEKSTFIAQLTELQSANDSLNKELAPANAALKEALAQVAQLTREIQTAKTIKQQEEATRLSITNDAEANKLALDQAQEKYTILNNQYTELEAELKKSSTKQAEQVSSLQSLLQQQTASTEVIQGDFEAKLAAAAESLKIANEKSTSLESEIEQLATTVSEQEQTIQELTSKTSADNNELVLKNSQLLEEIAAAKLLSDQQTEEHATSMKEQKTAINNLTTKLAASNKQLSSVQENLEQMNTQLAEKTHDINTQQQEIKNLNEQAAAVKVMTDQQTATLSSTKENLTTLQEKQSGLETSLNETQEQLVTSQEKVIALQGTITSLTEERNQLLLVTKDSDNDGVNDAEDTCSDTIQGAQVNAQGCEEDTDNDGLVNRLDLCPDTASDATIDSVGCAAEQKTVILEGISFQFGTAELAAEAHSILDSAAVILQNNPDVRMEVAGHTDSKGDNNANIHLSTLRAEAVLSYLVSAGVAAERLQAKGYGSDKPIADNASREGRAKNRRVELKRIDSSPAPQNTESAPTTTSESAE